MKPSDPVTPDPIAIFGLSWSFWTTFAWIQTRDTVIGYRLEVDKIGKPKEVIPTFGKERAMTGVHYHCCVSAEGESQHSPNECRLWQKTWGELQLMASKKSIQTFGVKRGDNVPTEIPASAWHFARRSSDPTRLDILTTDWTDVRFNADQILKKFKPRKGDGSPPIPEAELREWLIGILPEKPHTTKLVELASERFPDHRPPTRQLMKNLCIELNYFPPVGRPKKSP